MQVLGSKVAIEPIKVESKSATGIVLAVTEAKVSNRGKVIATGSKVDEVQPGDTVMFSNKYTPVEIEGQECYLMEIDNVECIL